MSVYKIAGLTVWMQPRGQLLINRAKQYRLKDSASKKEDCDIIIEMDTQGFQDWAKQYGEYPFESNEYTWTGYRFYSELTRHRGFFLHSSAVALDGRAYLFSADSGTGKSTHTGLWLKHFGTDRAVIINDDKPAVVRGEEGFLVCGTPFSGKHDISRNICMPAQALCFLERAEQNTIERIGGKEATQRIFSQIMRSSDRETMDMVLSMLDGFLSNTPAYVLRCNISTDAVLTAYNAMCGRSKL